MTEQNEKYFCKVNELRAARTPFVSVTLVESRGHTPQDCSAKILVTREGLVQGTVGGGKIEARAIQFAQEMLAACRPPALMTWNLQTEIGMSCGGEVTLFFETAFTQTWPVAVFGAGHVAQSLARLMINLNCQLTYIDPRADWLAKLPQSPRLTKIEHPHPAEAAAGLNAKSFIVVMTQGHATDFPILKTILMTHKPPYIGVIGSSVKGAKLRKELLEAGVSPERIELLHCPLGLTLGTNDPEEIAISIAAQLIQVRDKLEQ